MTSHPERKTSKREPIGEGETLLHQSARALRWSAVRSDKLRPGGLILAHNVEMVLDYVRAVTTNPFSESNACFKRETLRAAVRRGAAAP